MGRGTWMNEMDYRIITAMADCSMRITEVAASVYMARNTVVYRLQKIKKCIGLDPTNFHDLNKLLQMAGNEQTPEIVKVETSFYDKEETFPDCTVQVLTNTATGKTSVGWWKNGNREGG